MDELIHVILTIGNVYTVPQRVIYCRQSYNFLTQNIYICKFSRQFFFLLISQSYYEIE